MPAALSGLTPVHQVSIAHAFKTLMPESIISVTSERLALALNWQCIVYFSGITGDTSAYVIMFFHLFSS